MGSYWTVPGSATLAIVIGLSLCAVGCEPKDEDTDEETDEDVSGGSKSRTKDSDEPKSADTSATTTPDSTDTATPTPTSPIPSKKITLDAGIKSDAGSPKDAGAPSKPGNQACLQKCATSLGQCTMSAGKDAGPFALPNLGKCQTAADACRKACGH